jgi:hypothetical protein
MSAINYYKTPARDKILSSRGDIIFANKSQVSLRLRGGSYNNTCNWPFYNDARLRFVVIASPGFAIASSVLRIRVLLCADGNCELLDNFLENLRGKENVILKVTILIAL